MGETKGRINLAKHWRHSGRMNKMKFKLKDKVKTLETK